SDAGRDSAGESALNEYRPSYYTPNGWYRPDQAHRLDAGDSNLYRYARNQPTRYTDPTGWDIYVVTGASGWNPANEAVHQDIVVDAWEKKNGQWKKVGKHHYTFG